MLTNDLYNLSALLFYQDITDLLVNKNGIKIRNVGNEVIIENLTEKAVTSYEETVELVHKGIRKFFLHFLVSII